MDIYRILTASITLVLSKNALSFVVPSHRHSSLAGQVRMRSLNLEPHTKISSPSIDADNLLDHDEIRVFRLTELPGSLDESPPSNMKPESAIVGCISHHEAAELIILRDSLSKYCRKGSKAFFYHDGASIDLGRSETMVCVSAAGISLPIRGKRRGPVLLATWEELDDIVRRSKAGEVGCYALYADGCRPWRIKTTSLRIGRAAALLPARHVKGPPTVVSGPFLMHRLGGGRRSPFIGPAEDTRRKLDAIKMKRVYGRVLDTATGLGYTAIAASRCSHVSEVVTIEADDASMELCRFNPWSNDLFSRPVHGRSPIRVLRGDVCDVVTSFGDESFAAVMHDPPAMSLCKSSNLYGAAFYAELLRVLRWRGRFFHFVGGNPSDRRHHRVYRSIVHKLESVGFKRVLILASAQGIVAEKGEDRKSKKLRLHTEQRSRRKDWQQEMLWADSNFPEPW